VGEYLDVSLLASDLESGLLTVDIGDENKFVTSPYSTSILTKISEINVTVGTSSVKKTSVAGLKVRVRDKAGNKTLWMAVNANSPKSAPGVTPVRSTISLREISTPLEIANIAKLNVINAKKIVVSIQSKKTCMLVGRAVIGLKKGKCILNMTVTPQKGKLVVKRLNLLVN
jgi:hypothetical protein